MVETKWVSTSKTDIGTARKVNEDSLFESASNNIWCVADGMGGHARGDVASQLITSQLSSLVDQLKQSPTLQQINDCIGGANSALVELSRKYNSVVGSTVAILLFCDTKVYCIWAGDSRIYRLRNHKLDRLTRDHSQVEDMVKQGLISAEEAETHPKANIITRAVGAHEQLELEVISYDLDVKDKFILCSDGLNKVMTDNELQNFMQFQDISTAVNDLIHIALDRKVRDNVTVIIVENSDCCEHGLTDTMPLDSTLPLHTFK